MTTMRATSGSLLKTGLIVDGVDHFIKPIEIELRRRCHVDRFAPRFVRLPLIGRRVNDELLDRQLQGFIRDHDAIFFEWAGSLLVRASHLPKQGRIVTRLHSVELATAVEQVDWSQIDHLIVLNRAILDRLHDLVRQPLPPVTIVANGVDLDRYLLRPRVFQYRLGMVCNLLPIKRIYEIVLSLFQLRQDGQAFTLHIAGAPGEGDARRYAWALQSLVHRLRLEDIVTFYGYAEDVSSWLQEIDVFISNSYWEGQQVALLEAMASGCFCLSHSWAGVEEILPAENIFATGEDLRRKLVAYAALDEDQRTSKQLQMRQIAEAMFDERRMVDQVINVIDAVGSK